MREIKFRAISKYADELIIGQYYSKTLCDGYPEHHYLKIPGSYREIKPETLGQFTGHYDKNNKPGFEGDIVKYKTRSYLTDEKSMYTLGVIIWDEMKAGFYIAPIHMYEYYKSGNNKSFRGEHLNLKTKEIIGNIHQNKDLLK